MFSMKIISKIEKIATKPSPMVMPIEKPMVTEENSW